MVTYPDSAYNPAMQVYNDLVKSGLEEEAKAVMAKYKKYPLGEAPPDEMKEDLEALLTKKQQSGLEAKASAKTPSKKGLLAPSELETLVGLTGAAGALGFATALTAGAITAFGAIGLLAAGLAAYYFYSKKPQQSYKPA